MKTPQLSHTELAAALQVPEIYLKREDLHPYGSHKGRSIPHMIKTYFHEGKRRFVISSSGNAALAAIHTVEQHNKNKPNHPIDLTIYIGKHIDEDKHRLLRERIIDSAHIRIVEVDNPKQQAFQAQTDDTQLLRQSTDNQALVGYEELADELLKIPGLVAIFIPTSSGTTAEALGRVFLDRQIPIQIHIVQTTACHPIASGFDTDIPLATDHSVAKAIVDRVAHRKTPVTEIIRSTQGSGWVVSDEEIQRAMTLVQEKTGVILSPNSALSVAGLIKAGSHGWNWSGPIVCLITGR